MFVGAINEQLRQHLASNASVFEGAAVVVGCSGNFTVEAVLAAASRPAALHSNDVSLYSSALGQWLAGGRLPFEIADHDYDWLAPYLDDPEERLGALMVLLDMLEYEKRNNAHRERMWHQYMLAFPGLVQATAEKLRALPLRVSTYFAGDVLEHFEHFADQPDAIFCCYAPTYTGGYERQYKRLEKIFSWRAPVYPLLDADRRAALLKWLRGRRFLWYDDNKLDDMQPVLEQHSGGKHTVWLYSNVIQRPALFAGMEAKPLPRWPVATRDNLELTPETEIWLKRIKTSDLMRFKEAYLGKNITPASGMWAFAVMADALIIGFLEFSYSAMTARDQVYMMADFCVPGTQYQRLSRLIVQLAVSGQTGNLLRRLKEFPVVAVRTTAFTERAVSMKYRGVMQLEKRGEKDGKKFLNYVANFNSLSWKETYLQWLTSHGSKRR